jgi:hypothetical protein
MLVEAEKRPYCNIYFPYKAPNILVCKKLFTRRILNTHVLPKYIMQLNPFSSKAVKSRVIATNDASNIPFVLKTETTLTFRRIGVQKGTR